MRILIVSINYLPELTGIGKYTGEMAEWLATKGCSVKIITAPPYYPAWKISEGYSSYRYRQEYLNGVTVIRCPLWVPKRPSGAQRLLHLATFAVSTFPVTLWQALVWRPKLIFAVAPPLFCGFSAIIGGKLAGAETWLHIQDFEVDAAFSLGILKRRWLQAPVKITERWLMARFDRVSTISDRMIEKLAAKGVAKERQMLFENWVDLEKIKPLENTLAFRQEMNIPAEVKVLLYAGNMGKKQGLELIISAARMLQRRADLLFVLCGEGMARAELERTSSGYNNVMFLPLQPLDRLNELLNLADIHLLPQRAGVEDLVMPSKLGNILASGKPVVATAGPDSQIARSVGDAGVVVAPGDVDSFIREIERLADDPTLRLRFGKNGREFVLGRLEKETTLSKVFSSYLKSMQRANAATVD